MKNVMDSFSLKGKKALVVCPERRYGIELIKGFLAAGAKVWIAGNENSYYEKMNLPIEGCFPYIPGTEAQAEALVNSVKEEMVHIDILVENSVIETINGWEQTSIQICEQLEKTHLAMMQNVQKIGNIMAEQEKGCVLLVSDYGALVGYAPQNYKECEALKEKDFSLVRGFIQGGFVNYARQAAGYLGEHGCRCNCIAYGPLANTTDTAFEEAYKRHSHIKRLATEEELATAAIFLCSDAASYITGITMAVDGGYSAK